jgi:O-antigen biosynthesis protein WbqV
MENGFSRFRFHRGHLALIHDVVMAAVSFLLSLWFRMGDSLWTAWDGPRLAAVTALFTLVAGVVFISQRLYRGIWRYASTRDLIALVRAVTLVILVFLPLLFVVNRLTDFPRSQLAINWFVLLALLGGPRFLYRIARDRRLDLAEREDGARAIPVLLVGSGDAADLFLRAIEGARSQYRAVGILSDNAVDVGRHIHGVSVLGGTEALETAVAALRRQGGAPERLILTDQRLAGAAVRSLLDRADALGLALARLPRLTDLKEARTDKLDVRPIAVEDLLGRPQTVLDRDAMRALVAGRRVLVTGAGGSIGGELTRQLAEYEPRSLALLDASEFALYTIDMEMAERFPALVRHALIADVRDRLRIDAVMAEVRPDLVFHAAALKHVPLVEANPLEGLLTNAIGTRIIAEACRAHGVRQMVLISTDKAVNPSSVMGASKRVAEAFCQALDMEDDQAAATRFVTVRFGNVLGSTGSVVPLFQRQLAAGGPITVTDPAMTRYFMTIREAVALVLQASAFAFVHPRLYQGRIFVLDMGEPVKIVDLARQMIRLAGLRPEQDIAIRYTGIRPGEKLTEEIFHGAEAAQPTELDGVLIATVRAGDRPAIAALLDRLEAACHAAEPHAARAVLARLVPEFRPASGVVEAGAAVL